MDAFFKNVYLVNLNNKYIWEYRLIKYAEMTVLAKYSHTGTYLNYLSLTFIR